MQDRDSTNNWRDEFDDLEEEMKRISALADNVGANFAKGLSDAIAKGSSLRSMINQVGQSFKKLALDAALKPVEGIMSGLVQSIFTATNPTLPKIQAFAKGGVIQRPTYFSHIGGLGVAGEAGPEAILPLKRNASGQLGVAAQNTTPIQISMTVNATDATSFRRAEADLGATLLNAVKRGQRAN